MPHNDFKNMMMRNTGNSWEMIPDKIRVNLQVNNRDFDGDAGYTKYELSVADINVMIARSESKRKLLDEMLVKAKTRENELRMAQAWQSLTAAIAQEQRERDATAAKDEALNETTFEKEIRLRARADAMLCNAADAYLKKINRPVSWIAPIPKELTKHSMHSIPANSPEAESTAPTSKVPSQRVKGTSYRAMDNNNRLYLLGFNPRQSIIVPLGSEIVFESKSNEISVEIAPLKEKTTAMEVINLALYHNQAHNIPEHPGRLIQSYSNRAGSHYYLFLVDRRPVTWG